MSTRVCNEVKVGILRVDRAQALLGHEVDASQEIYLRPLTVMPVAADQPPEPTIHPQDQRVVEAGMQAEQDAANRPIAPAMKGDDIPLAVKARMNGNGHPTEDHDVAA